MSKIFFFRGQITLEMLMVGALALSLLCIAALSVSKMQKAQTTIFERAMLKDELNAIADYSDEICILGQGNSRTVPLSNVRFELRADGDGKILEISGGDWKMQRKTICPNIILGEKFGNEVYLWHENPSSVAISPEPKKEEAG